MTDKSIDSKVQASCRIIINKMNSITIISLPTSKSGGSFLCTARLCHNLSLGPKNSNNHKIPQLYFRDIATSFHYNTHHNNKCSKYHSFSNSNSYNKNNNSLCTKLGQTIVLSKVFNFQLVDKIHTTVRALNKNNNNNNNNDKVISCCWHCGAKLQSSKSPLLDCPECNSLQPIPNGSCYFKLFEFNSVDYNIDVKELTKAFRRLQTVVHPDKMSRRSSKEQNISQNVSAYLNKAYETLSDPLERGLYMLEKKGITIDEREHVTDMEFLADIMEINEVLFDDDVSIQDVKNILSKSQSDMKDLSGKVSISLKEGDLQMSKELLIKMRYFKNIMVAAHQHEKS